MRPMSVRLVIATSGLALTLSGVSAIATQASTASAGEIDCSRVLDAPTRQDAFAYASQASGVPAPVLSAVSYLQSRWDDHGATPSVAGGYGPMHLLAGAEDDRRGDDARGDAAGAGTLRYAAELTGVDAQTLRTDPNANICGGAAVIAAYGGGPTLGSWNKAVARYGSSRTFARDVYRTIRDGARRRTTDGERLALAAHPRVRVPSVATPAAETDCPAKLDCEWLPAGYELLDGETDPSSDNYGNHDKADRPKAPKLQYIVIHDTESTYDSAVNGVQDPAYGASWNYTIRSADGHIAQHLKPKDVGWQAGNWYVNAHSIGIEHEGKAGNGGWYTEAMYRRSAALVRYLTEKYDIPRDRSHIIGHDQIPGILPGYTTDMHWDPGPYWDWEHYMDLVGAPIGGKRPTKHSRAISAGDTVTVRPGFEDNPHRLTGCEQQSPGSGPCDPKAGTNFVSLYQEPSTDAPLARDPGWNPGENSSSNLVSDIGARAAAGTQLAVSKVRGDWLQVSWAGSLVWLHNPSDDPVVVREKAPTVTVTKGRAYARTFGRAYPERSAYPDTIESQDVEPIEYTLRSGQEYVIGNPDVATDYYYATSFDGSVPDDRTVVDGKRRYYLVWTGHRQTFVPASDVEVHGLGNAKTESSQ